MNPEPHAPPATEEDEPPPPLTAEELAAAFRGHIDPVPVSLLYNVSMLFVAVVMLALPPVYFAVVGLTGWGVFWYATHAYVIIQDHGDPRAILVEVLLYIVPLIVGGSVFAALIKPLLPSFGPREKPFALTRQREPALFALVEGVCEAVRAPMPRRVVVDCDVNAAASFRYGFLSLFGADLQLTIGLPLAAGLTLEEFAGVLAHEMGHFRQGVGMRVSYIVRSVNRWFARFHLACGRMAQAWSRADAGWIGVIVIIFLLLVRGVVAALVKLSEVISCLLMRQAEFDADRYEARLVGSQNFVRTALKLPLLGLASQQVGRDLTRGLRRRQLADDLPDLIARRARETSPELRKAMAGALSRERTGVFDTHPCTRARIESARREDAAGIFKLDAPATAVFSDFDSLCKAATFRHYKEVLGGAIRKDILLPNAQFVELHGMPPGMPPLPARSRPTPPQGRPR